MEGPFDQIANFFSGQGKIAPNPDASHNVQLLIEAKKKIETGIFTRVFKRPSIYFLEGTAYLFTGILFFAALLLWNKIENAFDGLDFINFAIKISSNNDLGLDDYSWISYWMLIMMLLPSVICFLLGRLLTKSRKRINVFIEVESMIDQVINNFTIKK